MRKTGVLPRRTKVLFSLGDLTISMPLVIVSFYQLNFLTDVAGLSPGLATTAILAGKLWDAFNDPLIGLWADRVQSPFGRRRILLAAGAAPLGLSFMLLWLVPDFAPLGKVLYYSLAIILFDTAFTVVHIAFNSLTPRLTGNFDEQSELHGYRMFFQLLGNLGSVVAITVIGWYVTNRLVLFRSAGMIMGALAIIPPLVVISVTGSYRDTSPGRKFRLESLDSVFRSRPFWMMVGFYLLSWTAVSILASMLIYFVSYNMQMPSMSNYEILTTQVAAMAGIPLVVHISKKRDKKTSFILGSVAFIVTLMGISLLQPGRTGLVLVYVLALLSGWGIAMWIVGQMLELRGYVTPVGEELALQPESALQAIRFVMGPLPTLMLVGAILLAAAYPITREMHQETLADLGRDDAPMLADMPVESPADPS